MQEFAGNPLCVEAFERVVHALPHQPEFRAVEIVTADARPARRETHLVVLVDREGGVDIDTVERIAARINASLDAFADPYTLEVSSAGVNRPLVRLDDYERFAGKNAKVVTTLAIGNAKTHRGVLGGVRGDTVILRTGKANDIELPIPFAAIKAANIEYDIRADLQRAKKENGMKDKASFGDPSGKRRDGKTAREPQPGGPAREASGGRQFGQRPNCSADALRTSCGVLRTRARGGAPVE